MFLGSGVTLDREDLIAHELTHVAQQRGAAMPELDDMGMTSPGDRAEQEAGGRHGHGAITASPVQIAPGPLVGGPRGVGGGGTSIYPGPADPQIDSFKYFEKYGKRHFEELGLSELSFETGSPYATWTHGSSKAFLSTLGNDLATSNVPAKPIDLAKQTLAPSNVSQLIDSGRDAANKDAREKGNDYNNGVTLELRKAYRDVIREALQRLVPRVIQAWNQRTLEQWAKRNKDSSIKIAEAPELSMPGVGVMQSHPIDRFMLGALTGFMHSSNIKVDFAAYRKAFPEEAKPRAGKDWFASMRPVKFEWQAGKQARRWIKVIDPIDATTEEVARELFGYPDKAYLITAAPPLFGFDDTLHQLKDPYDAQRRKFDGMAGSDPGSSVANQILVGQQADDAALNQATRFKADKVPAQVVLQQFDLVVRELRKIHDNRVFTLHASDILGTISRLEKRKADVAARSDSDRWNAQVRQQLEIVSKAQESLKILGKMYSTYEAWEAKNLAWEIGLLYIDAAVNSDLVLTARQSLDRANQRLISFPADWIDAQFRWIKRALLAARKNPSSGDEWALIRQLEQKEERLRTDLMTVRERLFTNPLAAQAAVDKVTAELQKLATGTAAVRNIASCNEVYAQLKGAKSATGWIRSLFSNRLTGNHGNDRLDRLAARAEAFQAEWDLILFKWRKGLQTEAAKELEEKSKTKDWRQFFDDVAKEIRDQATYDAWMTFALLVGISITTGFAGALLEPMAAAAAGPILGFVITVTTEAALFTTMSYFLVEKQPSLQGFKHEFGKNVVVFGVLKGISKLFAGAKKLLDVELKEAEVVAQFAAINGIALYEANKEKARLGETLTEADILRVSFDNLVFTIAVAIGGKMLAPAFRFKLRGEVGNHLNQIQTLHAEVLRLQQAAKTTKNKEVGQLLLERQRELLTVEREFIESLVKLTAEGRDAALKKGMTGDQYDALVKAQSDLGDATVSLREAEVMSRLEPVTKDQYLVEPGKSFEDAHKHYAETNKKGTSPITGVPGTRTFEVALANGDKMQISERAGKKGQVGTETSTIKTPGGEATPPRSEEVAKAHSVSDPVAVKAFEALYKAHPKETLAFLDATKSQPGLASKLLAMFGEHTLTHFKPTADNLLGIHGEIDISAAKIAELLAREPADIPKLVETAKNKGPAADQQYFETTNTEDGKPGSRLRFKSRLVERAANVKRQILESLGITDIADPRARFFESLAESEATRLWDLFNERGYKDPAVRKQAAEWAFSKRPRSIREFVAEVQHYDAEVKNQADRIETDTRAELARELVVAEGKKDSPLSPAEKRPIIERITQKNLDRKLQAETGEAWGKAAYAKAATEMGRTATDAAGKPTTAGTEAANATWKMNIDAQTGARRAGARMLSDKSNSELPGAIKAIADTLSFGSEADAAYHAHKHARELPIRPSAPTEMATYLDAARTFIRANPGTTSVTQSNARTVRFLGGGMHAIVVVTADGSAMIATFGKMQ